MADISNLLHRIDAEFTTADRKLQEFRNQQVHAYEEREVRLAQFQKTCEGLREIWQPRLEALSQKFGERVQVTPQISKTLREATFDFDSNIAHIRLKFTASTDDDVRKLVLDYQLEILPILMKFEPHQQIEFPLEAIPAEAVAHWIDDRIVDFVRTFLSLHQNEYYLKDHLVVDPIAGVRFPKFAAASTLDWEGKKYYFIGDKTRQEFARKHGITVP
jgi:YHS domain-containing protein/ATP-dependent Lon protease